MSSASALLLQSNLTASSRATLSPSSTVTVHPNQHDNTVNPVNLSGYQDLQQERKKSKWDNRQLSSIIFTTQKELDDYLLVHRMIDSLPIFHQTNSYLLNREQLHIRIAERFAYYRKMLKEGQLDHLTPEQHDLFRIEAVGYGPFSLHYGMFIPALLSQADEEQQAYWLPLARQCKILGCYAQTELGHGSNIRGLETTAHYLAGRDEFVLNSPTLTSLKYWPGSLGRTATHAVLYARLLIPKVMEKDATTDTYKNHDIRDLTVWQDKGIHSFIIQLRDLDTHHTLTGIEAGDIGPKHGGNVQDNGFLRLTNVYISRRQMLMKTTRLSRTGQYERLSVAQAATYNAMLHARAFIIKYAANDLAKSLTIATRYCSIRRQFHNGDSSSPSSTKETAVLDYSGVQHRLIPLIALTYAVLFNGQWLFHMYQTNSQRMLHSNQTSSNSALALENLKDLHTTCSGLKSVATTLVSDALETCRRACGGQGYVANSGLCYVVNDFVANNTVEGDNYMIVFQLSRHLLSKYNQIVQEKLKSKDTSSNISKPNKKPLVLSETLQYLWSTDLHEVCPLNATASTSSKLNVDESTLLKHPLFVNKGLLLVKIYEFRAAKLIAQTASQIAQGVNISSLQWEMYRLARAHAFVTILKSFRQKLLDLESNATPLDPSLAGVLLSLYHLFALHYLLYDDQLQTLDMFPYVTEAVILEMKAWHRHLISVIRPHAVTLMDAYQINDRVLNSSIGSYHGGVYEKLYDNCVKNPFNKEPISPAFHPFLKSILHNDFSQLDPQQKSILSKL